MLRLNQPAWRLAAAVLLILALPAGQPRAAAADAYTIFLPLGLDTRPAIFGHVTDAGVPAAGALMELSIDSTAGWVTQQTATTSASGLYVFRNPAALPGYHNYRVQFRNVAAAPGWLRDYTSQPFYEYDGQSVRDMGAINIDNVALITPTASAAITFPHYFEWLGRSATPSDHYALYLYYPGPVGPGVMVDNLPYGVGYTIATFPSSVQYPPPYQWTVVVRGPNGGSGNALEARWFTLALSELRPPAVLSPLLAPP